MCLEFFTISLTLGETVTAAGFGTFTFVRVSTYGLQNLCVSVYKTNIDCSFIRGMVENYFTLCKIQPWPTILRAR